MELLNYKKCLYFNILCNRYMIMRNWSSYWQDYKNDIII